MSSSLSGIKVTLQDCIIIIGKRRASENPEVWNPKTYGYHKKHAGTIYRESDSTTIQIAAEQCKFTLNSA